VRALVQFAGLDPWRHLPFLTSASTSPRGASWTHLGASGGPSVPGGQELAFCCHSPSAGPR
jgi:hypothetical protein